MVEVFYTRNKYNLMKNRHSLMQLAMANILHAHDPTRSQLHWGVWWGPEDSI